MRTLNLVSGIVFFALTFSSVALHAQQSENEQSERAAVIFNVENAKASAIHETLAALFPSSFDVKSGDGLINLVCFCDESANSLVVVGPPGDIQDIGDLIARLDTASDGKKQTSVF